MTLAISGIPDAEASPRNQATAVYEALRQDILAGRLGPGKKLKVQDLAATLGVSPGAVREALSRLVPEQLVVSRDQRGFTVAPLSIGDLEDLTELRCEIEAIAVRRSIARADVDWEAGLIAAEHRLRGMPPSRPGTEPALNPLWVTHHAAFHTALIGACGNRRLLALHARLYEQSERYRGLSTFVDSVRNIADEHQQITAFALARDADRLVDALTAHMRETTRLIVAAARNGAILEV
ncbi:MAG: hypothetical protein JWR77_638 [Rhizorhabdus sp.]|nr:hypothetical protein [Rhizorhabdus sp.]